MALTLLLGACSVAPNAGEAPKLPPLKEDDSMMMEHSGMMEGTGSMMMDEDGDEMMMEGDDHDMMDEDDDDRMEHSSAMMQSSSAKKMEESSKMEGGMMEGNDMMGGSSAMMEKSTMAKEPRIIRIEAGNWAFTPSSITVKKGEKVKLQIAGVSGRHGFALSDFGINVSVDAGQTVLVDLPTETAGTFNFRCSIPCGPGHRDMTGTIVIQA